MNKTIKSDELITIVILLSLHHEPWILLSALCTLTELILISVCEADTVISTSREEERRAPRNSER